MKISWYDNLTGISHRMPIQGSMLNMADIPLQLKLLLLFKYAFL